MGQDRTRTTAHRTTMMWAAGTVQVDTRNDDNKRKEQEMTSIKRPHPSRTPNRRDTTCWIPMTRTETMSTTPTLKVMTTLAMSAMIRHVLNTATKAPLIRSMGENMGRQGSPRTTARTAQQTNQSPTLRLQTNEEEEEEEVTLTEVAASVWDSLGLRPPQVHYSPEIPTIVDLLHRGTSCPLNCSGR